MSDNDIVNIDIETVKTEERTNEIRVLIKTIQVMDQTMSQVFLKEKMIIQQAWSLFENGNYVGKEWRDVEMIRE